MHNVRGSALPTRHTHEPGQTLAEAHKLFVEFRSGPNQRAMRASVSILETIDSRLIQAPHSVLQDASVKTTRLPMRRRP